MEDKNKYIDKFKETHNWSEYCYDRKLQRVERLKEQGVVNPWCVVNGEKPRDFYTNAIGAEGRIVLPAKFRKQMGVNSGDKLKITMVDDKIILERVITDE